MSRCVCSGSFSLLFLKGMICTLMWISKEEKFALVEKYPNAEKEHVIYRTMNQRSDRGHYAVTTYPWVLQFLDNYWKSRITERFGEKHG